MRFSEGPSGDVHSGDVAAGNAASANAEHLLGELASRLEARLECRGLPPAPPAGRARLVFAPQGLTREEHALFAEAPGAELGPAEDGLARLVIAPEVLSALAQNSPAARCLDAALRAATAPPGPARLMGIVNVTPDSFSDGGAWLDGARAIEHGLRLIEEGAELIDVGGESTRPGAAPVSVEVELERVLPVIRALAQDGRAVLSIDTTKSEVARAALDAGASVVNDVSAGRSDARLLPLVAERQAGLILMHMQGTPRTMQDRPSYADVVREVAGALRACAQAAWRAGVEPARIALDPGLGFGKLVEHNLALMRALPELRSLGFPLCVGLSRKSFLGHLSGQTEPARRTHETSAGVALCAYLGAEIHRVHEVAPARAALRVAQALTRPGRD